MVLLWPPINGAYTELFSGLSSDITVEESGTLSTANFQSTRAVVMADVNI